MGTREAARKNPRNPTQKKIFRREAIATSYTPNVADSRDGGSTCAVLLDAAPPSPPVWLR